MCLTTQMLQMLKLCEWPVSKTTFLRHFETELRLDIDWTFWKLISSMFFSVLRVTTSAGCQVSLRAEPQGERHKHRDFATLATANQTFGYFRKFHLVSQCQGRSLKDSNKLSKIFQGLHWFASFRTRSKRRSWKMVHCIRVFLSTRTQFETALFKTNSTQGHPRTPKARPDLYAWNILRVFCSIVCYLLIFTIIYIYIYVYVFTSSDK